MDVEKIERANREAASSLHAAVCAAIREHAGITGAPVRHVEVEVQVFLGDSDFGFSPDIHVRTVI